MFQFEIQQIKGTRVLASLTYLTSVLDLGMSLLNLAKKIYSKRWSEWPIDFIIKSESDFEKRKIAGGVCYEASLYGIEMKP